MEVNAFILGLALLALTILVTVGVVLYVENTGFRVVERRTTNKTSFISQARIFQLESLGGGGPLSGFMFLDLSEHSTQKEAERACDARQQYERDRRVISEKIVRN